jgi:hypothetical protein
MKQGRASVSGPADRKMEPISRAVNPGGAGNIGLAQGSHAEEGDFTPRITPLYAGRGFEAPAIRTTSHKSGSQGKF